jgi:diguanylate cyclase (GGDEF)-like protein
MEDFRTANTDFPGERSWIQYHVTDECNSFAPVHDADRGKDRYVIWTWCIFSSAALAIFLVPLCHASISDLDALIKRAESVSIKARPHEARQLIDQLLDELEAATPQQHASIHLLEARNLALAGEFQRAVEILRDLLKKELSDDHEIRAHELLANLLFQVNQYHDAFHHLFAAIELAHLRQNPNLSARIYSLAAHWHTQLGDIESGMGFARSAQDLLAAIDDHSHRCFILEKLALAHIQAEIHEEALDLGQQALKACREAGNLAFMAAVKASLGKSHHLAGNLPDAERWLKKGIETAERAQYEDGRMIASMHYARILFEQGRIDQSRRILEDIVTRSESRQRWRPLRNAHDLLARIARLSGDHELTLAHFQKHMQAHERYLQAERSRVLALNEVQFNVQAKQQELELLREQIRLDTLRSQSRIQERGLKLIGYGLVTILLVILILLLIHVVRERGRYRLLSRRDSLTRLNNHTSFFELASVAVDDARTHSRKLTLVLADIDHFKAVNDRYGHLVGDQVLRRVAGRLHEIFARDAIIGRVGGEEFGILLAGQDADTARKRVDRFRERLSQTRRDDPLVTVTMSFGIGTLEEEPSIAALRRKTDQALYRAKKKGRNCIALA